MSNFLVIEYVIRIFDTRLSKLNCKNPKNVLIKFLLQIEIMKNLNMSIKQGLHIYSFFKKFVRIQNLVFLHLTRFKPYFT